MATLSNEFTGKRECQTFCKEQGLNMYQRDLNANFKKIFIATTHETIYQRIKSGENNFYEHLSSKQPLKFYIDYDDDKHLHENEMVHKTNILAIINMITQYFKDITDVYILKSVPNDTKRSYHLIFEGIHFSDYTNIKLFVIQQLKPKFPELFTEKIIDTSVYADKCLRSLGCAKYSQNRVLYLLHTESFIKNLEEIIIPFDKIDLDLFKKTCITHIAAASTLFTYKSIEKKKETNSKKIHLINDGDIYSDKDIVQKYLDILDPIRYTERNKWLNIGYILYSLNHDYIDLWHHFSSKWENYNKNECDIAWDSFTSNEQLHTIHNLIHLAKIDNINDFTELSTNIPDHDIKFLRPFDSIISKLIYRLYGEQFVCSNPGKNEWYFFDGVRWIEENKSHNLRKLIINNVFHKVEVYRKQLVKDNANEELVKNYHNILKILGSGIKLNCLELEFYNSNFCKIIDLNKSLIGFDNGVYDLDLMEFRRGNPSDHISMSVNYNYNEYTEADEEWKEITELLVKIFPIKDIREFTLKALSSTLDGYIRDEKFFIFSGKSNSGGNGKTTLVELLSTSLGDYAYAAPVSLITSKRESANSANSALFGMKNKRFVVMQEPASTEIIQASTVKALSGGDRVSCRELHEKQQEFIPHGKLFVCTNKIPPLSDQDGGIERRVMIIEFIAKFVDNPTGEYEYKIDKELKNRLKEYAPVFMCIMLKYYKLYRSEGLIPPEQVLKVTKQYHSDNNTIKQFVDEQLSIGEKTCFVTRKELKDIFTKDNVLKTCFGKFSSFCRQLETYLCTEFKIDKKGNFKLYGYSIKIDFDEYDETEV